MNAAIDITEEQRKILVGLLHRYLPDVDVWAYGSRVKWTARPNSDLDLVAFAAPELESQVAELKDALAESDLPFLVDLHIWDDVPKRFHEIIRKEYVVLHERKDAQKHLEIVSDWTAMTLGSVTHFTSGGTPSKQNAAYWSGCIPWLSAKDMKSFYIDDTEDHITQEGLENGSRLAPAGTVFLLARGMTLLNDVPICVSRRPMAFNQDVKGLTVDDGFLIPEFLPYLLLGHKATLLDLVDLAGHGTGRLNTDELKSLRISVPPKVEQRLIANVLRSLDDKIELNRKMNETLEATARMLFRSWFVDFDPVRAKSEDRDFGLPSKILALFPDSFQPSKLGEIPTGWSTANIYELADVIYGAPFSSALYNAEKLGKPLIRIRDLRDEAPEVFTSEIHPKGYTVMPGDIVVGMDGEFRAYVWGGKPAWLNQRVCVFKPKRTPDAAFVLNSIASLLAFVEATETATTVIHLGKSDIDQFVLLLPTHDVLDVFAKIAQPLYDKIVFTKRESRTLVELRDTLLPQLISGELRVNTAAQRVEAAL